MKLSPTPDLRSAFPPPDRAAWTAAATAGNPPIDLGKLRTVLPEGIATEPILTPDDAPAAPGLPGTGDRRRGPAPGPRSWLIAQPFTAASPADWNAAARAALDAGQNALLADGALLTADAAAALQGIDLAATPLLLQGAGAGLPAARAALEVLSKKAAASSAQLFFAPDCDDPAAIRTLLDLAPALPASSFLAVSGLPFHQAGADAARELGLVLARATAIFRALDACGVPPAAVPGPFRIQLTAGAHIGLTIAKFRAARALWTRFAATLGLPADRRDPFLHAVTAPRGRSWLDAPTNTLRATNEAFGAIVGGADAVTLEPWDALLRSPSDAAQRLARNTQIILRDECLLATVADPAGGSWYFERLTEDLAAAAWAFFQDVESRGGLPAVQASGWLSELLSQAAKAEAQRLARRRDVLVGVNQYADPAAPIPVELAAAADTPARRPAVGYEQLRSRVAATAAKRGRPLRVFLANIGPLKQHQARADFSRAFFEAGGLEVVYPAGFSDPAAASSAAAAAAPDLIVLCSTDDTYPEAIPAYAPALKATVPAATIVVAGEPGDREAADRNAGVSAWIHRRSDHLATLTSLLGFTNSNA